jgi:hypothetical protein
MQPAYLSWGDTFQASSWIRYELYEDAFDCSQQQFHITAAIPYKVNGTRVHSGIKCNRGISEKIHI